MARSLGFATLAPAGFSQLVWAIERFDAVVAVAPVPVVVRAIASVSLPPKRRTPAVLALDRDRRWAVPLLAAHRGATALARRLAELTGATAVLTTRAEALDQPALDAWGAIAPDPLPPQLQDRLNHGAGLRLRVRPNLRLPGWLSAIERAPKDTTDIVEIVVSEERTTPAPRIIPRTLVAGIGLEQRATADDVRRALEAALTEAGLEWAALGAVATIDRRRLHPALGALGLPVVGFAAPALAEVSVPNPSSVVAAAVATPSVAEAAALLLAGETAELLVPKQVLGPATVAIARRSAPLGMLWVVGLGPGSPDLVTPRARGVLARATLVVGYDGYLEQAALLLGPQARTRGFGLGEERERARYAVAAALEGELVAILASGDPGIYALASLAIEEANGRIPVEVVPGVTASLATSARGGAILGHDHAVISLSDLLTPWETIQRRLEAAAIGDFVVVLYNPRSARRAWQLDKALAILGAHRAPTTPVLIAHDVERPSERLELTTLADVDTSEVSMHSLVVVGQRATRALGGLVLTPRGYGAQR